MEGLVLLQEGDPEAAMRVVEQAVASVVAGAPGAFANSTLALAYACAGRPDLADAAGALVVSEERAAKPRRRLTLPKPGRRLTLPALQELGASQPEGRRTQNTEPPDGPGR